MIAGHGNHSPIHMLDSRTHEWLSRLQGNGPRLVSLGLAALIAVELARIAISLLSGGPVKSPQPVLSGGAPPAQHAGLDVQSVVSAHLFGIAAPDPSTQDPANAPQSTANLVLAGTIATQDPKRGVAIRPGGDPRTVAAVDNIRRLVQQDPGILDQVMRTVPSYDNAAGRLRGFRAYPGRNRQIFNKLGLRPGDLVTAINGTPLDDPQRSQDVFNTIQTSDHVTVTIERGGQKQEITLNIAQVAAQATKELDGEANAAAGGAPNGAPQPPPGNPSPNGSNTNSNE